MFAGESLWSIADDVLGGRASVAQVAREVNRLCALNGDRIGTGNRDLLPVGTRLVGVTVFGRGAASELFDCCAEAAQTKASSRTNVN